MSLLCYSLIWISTLAQDRDELRCVAPCGPGEGGGISQTPTPEHATSQHYSAEQDTLHTG